MSAYQPALQDPQRYRQTWIFKTLGASYLCNLLCRLGAVDELQSIRGYASLPPNQFLSLSAIIVTS